jgi:hypothetical protein
MRLRECDSLWRGAVREKLTAWGHAFSQWDIRTVVLVRGENVDPVQRGLASLPYASVISLDDVVFSWRWQWDAVARPHNRLDSGIPSRATWPEVAPSR